MGEFQQLGIRTRIFSSKGTVMPLTDIAVRNAKPGNKPIKMFDTGGLFLLVASSGGLWFRLRYRFNGREKLLSLGVYPDVS